MTTANLNKLKGKNLKAVVGKKPKPKKPKKGLLETLHDNKDKIDAAVETTGVLKENMASTDEYADSGPVTSGGNRGGLLLSTEIASYQKGVQETLNSNPITNLSAEYKKLKALEQQQAKLT
tara:strand:+ start:214 stop:576 length:363 start_codon:yes stop_codon:yes gene_type:complete